MGRHTRSVTLLAAVVAAAVLSVTTHRLALTPSAAVVGAGLLALFILPFGVLASWDATRALPRGERWALAAVVGYPVGAATYQMCGHAGAEPLFLVIWAVCLGLAVRSVRRDAAGAGAVPGPEWWTTPALVLIVPPLLLLSTRGLAPFHAQPGGLAYPHGIDSSIHLSFFWEMRRGFPPEQLPTVAGTPFPSYHVLSFVPGVLLARVAGLSPMAVHHGLSPLLRLALLMAALYAAVRLRSNDRRVALASLPAILVLGPWLERLLEGRVLALPSPFYFLVHSESTGGGVAVWAAVFCLIALHQRHGGAQAVVLAAVLAGFSIGFKAQMFVLFAPAMSLALAASARRMPWRHAAWAAVAGLAAFHAVFWTSRGSGPIGGLHFDPGHFARLYVYLALAADPWPWVHRSLLRFMTGLPAWAGAAFAAVLVVWRIAAFSPAVPLVVLHALRGRRSRDAVDLAAAAAFLVAVLLAFGFSASAIDGGRSPFEFAQGAHALAVLAGAVNVLALASVLCRRGHDAGRWVLFAVLAVSLPAAVTLWMRAPHVPAREAIVLSTDELCALRFLRDQTPLDTVTIGWRDEPVEGGRAAKRLNHQAVLGGLAGRRSVLEYYDAAIDPAADRAGAIVGLFTTTSAARGEAALDRHRVDYVVEFATRPLRFSSPRLSPVYTRGSVRVLRMRRAEQAGVDRHPPRTWGDSPAFVCPDAR